MLGHSFPFPLASLSDSNTVTGQPWAAQPPGATWGSPAGVTIFYSSGGASGDKALRLIGDSSEPPWVPTTKRLPVKDEPTQVPKRPCPSAP